MDEPTQDNKEQLMDRPDKPESPARRRTWRRWIIPVLSLAVTVAAGLLLYDKLRSDTWSYFTDEEGMRVEVDEDRHRFILWGDPTPSTFPGRLE